MKLKFDVGEKKQIAGLRIYTCLVLSVSKPDARFLFGGGLGLRQNQTHTNCT